MALLGTLIKLLMARALSGFDVQGCAGLLRKVVLFHGDSSHLNYASRIIYFLGEASYGKVLDSVACLFDAVLMWRYFFKVLPAVSFSFVLNWDAFSAVGTIAAVVLSLYLATDADRKLLAEKSKVFSGCGKAMANSGGVERRSSCIKQLGLF